MPDKRITVWVQRFKDRPHLVLQWLDPNTGKRRSRSAGTADRNEAEARRVDLEADLNNCRYQEVSRMSWQRFRELFEAEYLPGVRPNTQSNYRNCLDLFERVCNVRTLRAVTARTLSAFVAGLRSLRVRGGKTGMEASTISVRLQELRAVLSWAVQQDLLPRVPEFPQVKVPRTRPRPVPAETVERLLERAAAEDRQLFAFLTAGWLAGLRLGEALALEWEETDRAPWVDLARERIWLPATVVKAAEDQWVPLDPLLRDALLALPRRGRKVFHFAARDGHLIRDNAVAARVSRLAKRVGVRLTMRVLRRGFGCYYASRVPAQVLQRLMRHSSITTTMTFYANVDSAVEAAVRERPRPGQRNSLCNSGPSEAPAASPQSSAEAASAARQADRENGAAPDQPRPASPGDSRV